MKALRTKVILSGIVLVFAFIATIGTTFAWFTVSQTATVEEMTLNVQSADNLLIKAFDSTETYVYDTTNTTANPLNLALPGSYKTNLLTSDLVAAGYALTGVNAWRLSPATVAAGSNGNGTGTFGKVFHVLDSNLGSENRSYSPATGNSEDGYYITLQFILYSQSENAQNIALENFWVVSNEDNTSLQANIANAVRISVWAEADFDLDIPANEFDTPRSADNGATLFGLTDDYGYTFTGDFEFTGWNLYGDTNMVGLHAATGPAVTAVTTDTNSSATLFKIQPSTPTLVTVVIYVEGWQEDADNDISEGSFDIQFGFKSSPAL